MCDAERFKFERPRPGAGFYKFPPTIGATGRAHLLFVGLNPRRSGTNLDLHVRVMRDITAFDALARDRERGRPYLQAESYYDDIRSIAAAAFPGRMFSEVAAVSEFYLCATEKTRHMMKSSPCAPRFLHRVIPLVAPSIILPVGKVVADHFRRIARVENREPFRVAVSGHAAHVGPMPHRAAQPNAYPPGESYATQLERARSQVVDAVERLQLREAPGRS
jgi:hypothetical protein